MLDDGTSVYDLLGRDFTLVRVGAKAPGVEKILEASAERKVPLKVVDLPSDAAAERFRAALILRVGGLVAASPYNGPDCRPPEAF
ncbi:hypothetical protein ACIG56_03235 [Nocardia fusca]|uniref:hypothetical protein n=1 Tax=Nocardia fusca TaxID=941183 RepID=UPI0037C64B38